MSDDVIDTERLRLRRLQPSDAAWIAREVANPRVQRWLTTPPHPYRLEDAQDFIATFGAHPGYRVIEQSGTPLGVISRGTELGYWLKESAWGQGLMSEAARAMVAWHWAQSAEPLASGWIIGNSGSAQILTQLGFAPAGPVEKLVHFLGETRVVEQVRLEAPYAPLFTCKTERLVLNALTLNDLPVVHAEWGAPEIARMTSSVTPNWTLSEARSWLEGRTVGTKDGFGRAVRLRDGTLIGSVGMGGAPRNLGYMFGKAHWGQGYASEALRAFLPAALAHFPEIEAVEGHVFDDNPASAHLLVKLGFQRQGPGDSHSLGRVEPSPATRYRITRSDLRA
jgi:RimJ/RimL family protein N-acetyltransferase